MKTELFKKYLRFHHITREAVELIVAFPGVIDGALARIEVPARDLEVVEHHLPDIRKRFAPLGFIDIELREFKSGSLNALIHAQKEY